MIYWNQEREDITLHFLIGINRTAIGWLLSIRGDQKLFSGKPPPRKEPMYSFLEILWNK